MKTQVYARVQVTVEIAITHDTWSEQSTVEQVDREARELATKRITDLCQRYVKLIGVPNVEQVITRKER